MKDENIFQDDLHTADKIEAARKAREQQINKGICYVTTPLLETDIEKAVQSQEFSANGGGTDLLSPEVEDFKKRLENTTETQVDLYLQSIQKQMIYRPNDEALLQMRSILLDKKNELRTGEKATLQALSAARKSKSIVLSPEDITNGSRARDKAVKHIADTLKEEFGDIQADLKDGVHRGGGILIYKNANIVWDKNHSEDVPLLVNIPASFSNRDLQSIKTRTTELAKQYGMHVLFGQRTADAILWITTRAYYDEDGNWHDAVAEQSLKKNK
ncbi:hypothetical protein [Coprobacter fastidiosus]|uniref:Uncharacterized protein n=1 Tax=Coprobacter fastidiosus NSB1 = JCM 33896 TaxID=1349822 RepID=A0A495VJZ2_9BACT|nr:hypothetical protein [Coprobacter fastidiosus]ERM88975.1 hypothetical protein NSB1T_12075 [Coprobacter fastidiosus NSB1 = JCM 33896]RKT49220.1 hypothetical protein BC742_2762 [Coprobacter fastidiosus NSB1 = JCM 33896]BEG61635.1 hypothetical protein Cfast33896_05900 [Coprobacter fastidiosus]